MLVSKLYRAILGTGLLTVALSAFVNNHIFHQYIWNLYEVGMIVGFAAAGIAMINESLLVTLSRVAAKFIPGASKRVTGQTMVIDLKEPKE